jgi:hypothetical protein
MDDLYVDFKGWRFRAPFRCLCCGQVVSIEQFCYGRYCGICDSGKCQHENKNCLTCYSGPRELLETPTDPFIRPDRWLNPATGLEGAGENPNPKLAHALSFPPI